MKSLSIYIHIPFCFHKCLFCSFAIAVGQTHRADDYLNCLDKEIQGYKKYHGRTLQTLYIGGGTPSVLSQEQIQRLMSLVQKYFSLSSSCEITFEANPEGFDESKAKAIYDLGINRISLGVQSLNDKYLKYLGRKHDAKQAVAMYQMLRKTGFRNINLDLMYGFPSQSLQELRKDVREISSLDSEHLSLYTLTIEENSRFYINAIQLDDNDKLAEHYTEVKTILLENGFDQYEISNFSKKGFSSKHNCNYWIGDGYLGFGMGAHGFVGHRRYWNQAKLQDYLKGLDFVEGFEDLSEETLLMEKILFGLRMNQGIELSLIPKNKESLVKEFVSQGFFETHQDRLMVSDKGQLVLDELSLRLI